MKKDKTAGKAPVNFKNNPFHSLKGLAPRLPSTESKARQPAPSPGKQTEDDSTLFLRAVEGARKLGEPADSSSAGPRPDKTARTVPADDAEEQRRFLEAMKKIGPVIRETRGEEEVEAAPRRQSASTSRLRQLKRGTITIGEELDLHGFFKDEALVRLERFIASAFSRGLRAVLVITGKGINSPEGPVLQGAVYSWLREKGRGMVAEFTRAPRDKGGSGAFVVFLKNR
jgi:DNA-nicking Smr family endonuclease